MAIAAAGGRIGIMECWMTGLDLPVSGGPGRVCEEREESYGERLRGRCVKVLTCLCVMVFKC